MKRKGKVESKEEFNVLRRDEKGRSELRKEDIKEKKAHSSDRKESE